MTFYNSVNDICSAVKIDLISKNFDSSHKSMSSNSSINVKISSVSKKKTQFPQNQMLKDNIKERETHLLNEEVETSKTSITCNASY